VPQHREKHRHHTIDVDGVESTFMFTFAQVPRLLLMAAEPTRKCLIAHTISCYSRASVGLTFFKKSWRKGARISHVFYKAVEKYATIYFKCICFEEWVFSTAYFWTPFRVILLQYFCKYKNFKQLALYSDTFFR